MLILGRVQPLSLPCRYILNIYWQFGLLGDLLVLGYFEPDNVHGLQPVRHVVEDELALLQEIVLGGLVLKP